MRLLPVGQKGAKIMNTTSPTVYGTPFGNREELTALIKGSPGRIRGQLWVQWDADSWMPTNWVRVTHANAPRAALADAVQEYGGDGVRFVLNDGTDLNPSPRQLISLDPILGRSTRPALFD